MGSEPPAPGDERIVLPVQPLAAALRDALTGPAHLGADTVVWNDRGSQLVLYVGKLQVQPLDPALVVAVDTDSAELGPAPLIVRFVFGTPQDVGTLVVATDQTALGHPLIAARWGGLFRDVIWAALVRYVVAHADTKGLVPTALHLADEGLMVRAEPPVSLPDLAREHVRAVHAEMLAGAPTSSASGSGPSTSSGHGMGS